MELALKIYLIFGLSFCLAAPLQKKNSSLTCFDNTEILTNHADIIKNCNNFTQIHEHVNYNSTNVKNDTLCTLYHTTLALHCQLNGNSVKYPKLQDIQNNKTIETICTNLIPNLKTILTNSTIVTCYSLCGELVGNIRPECLYADYYKNLSVKLNPHSTGEVSPQRNEAVPSGGDTEISIVNPHILKGITESGTQGKDSTEFNNRETGAESSQVQEHPKPSSKIDQLPELPILDQDTQVDNKQSSEPPKPELEETEPKPAVENEHPDVEHQQVPVALPANNGENEHPADEHQQAPVAHPANNGQSGTPAKNTQTKNKDKAPIVHPDVSDTIVDPINDESDYLENLNNVEAHTSEDAANNVPQQQEVIDNFDHQEIDTDAKQDGIQGLVDQKVEKKPDFVQDSPISSENVDDIDDESYFFSYFMVICILFILGYVGYHNRIKVMALLLEGKRGKRQQRGRRPNSANYHKLDTNLEEAISSNVTKNSNNVIY